MSKGQRGWMSLAIALLVSLGCLLVIQTPAQANSQSEAPVKHKVSRGQNLWLIANKYGVTVTEIVQWNGLTNPNRVYPGQSLIVYAPKPEPEQLISAQDVELLARVIYAEARGENFDGQVAVGAVILNRLKDPSFPKTIRDVVFQPGAFTAVSDKQIKLQPDETAWLAAKTAIKGVDPTGGALFYYNPSTARDRWIRTRPVLKVIGNHTFSS